MKPLTTIALAMVLGLVVVTTGGCRAGDLGGDPGWGYADPGFGSGDPGWSDGDPFRGDDGGYGYGYGYGQAPGAGGQGYADPWGSGPGSGPGYGYGYGYGDPYRRAQGRYRYPGDNERCNDRRQACQKWSSKRDRYIPDYGETRRQYGKKAERRQRDR